MAYDSNEKIKWVCLLIVIELHSIFHKGCINEISLSNLNKSHKR